MCFSKFMNYFSARLKKNEILIDPTDKNLESDSSFLLERLKTGDRSIFTRLFEYYYSGLVIYADHFLNNLESAEDIVQSVFVRLWENRTSINSSSIRFYLLNSTRNSCIDQIRKKETRDKYISRQIYQSGHFTNDFWAEHELEKMIETAIEKLPLRCQEIFKMSRVDGLKSKEIAQKLQISQRTVETQITNALKILRKELKDYLLLILFSI